MEENQNKTFSKKTEDTYAKETEKAVQVPCGMAEKVERTALKNKKKTIVTVSVCALLAVLLTAAIVIFCVGASRRSASKKNVGDSGFEAGLTENSNGENESDGDGGRKDPPPEMNTDPMDEPSNSGDKTGGSQTDPNGQSVYPGEVTSGSSLPSEQSPGEPSTNGKDQNVTPPASDTSSQSTPQTPGSPSENTPEPGGVDLSGVDKADENLELQELIDRIGSIGISIIKRYTFASQSGSLNWYEFYNACIDGTVDPHSADAKQYCKTMYDIFVSHNMELEASQASNVLSAK